MVHPSVSQARAWHPEALRGLADAWDVAAGQVRSASPEVRPAGTGAALDAARAAIDGIDRSATSAARSLVAAAVAARCGADRIAAARGAVLEAVESATTTGYGVSDDGAVTPPPSGPELLEVLGGAHADVLLASRATQLGRGISAALGALAEADADTARNLADAFGLRATSPVSTHPAGATVGTVPNWPTMAQERIAEQIATMSPEQRRQLIAAAPQQVGNTDGVPWEMRMAANRINVADAILVQRRTIDEPVDDKIRAVVRRRYGTRIDRISFERVRQMIASDPGRRAAAIADHDRIANARITFYQGLLADVPDPVHPDGRMVQRKILAFDTDRSALVELTGELSTATSVGVLVPGLNTTVLDSAANTETVRRFVAAGAGDVAMITYLGGPFPTGGLWNAANPHYAQAMAPRLVAFSEDVDRTVDSVGTGTGRHIAVTYLGHSYGGSILGTAERMGLTADRTVYVEAAGTGVGVYQPQDWHNRNPAVERFSMTAPGDPIELVQGLPLGVHGADPDDMAGVIRLDTGRRLDGSVMGGLAAHGDVLNEPSDAWHELLRVITGQR